MASRLLALHPGHVHSLALIDPVCIGMCMPHLVKSFVYRLSVHFLHLWLLLNVHYTGTTTQMKLRILSLRSLSPFRHLHL